MMTKGKKNNQQIYRHISVYLYMKGGKQIIYKEEGI